MVAAFQNVPGVMMKTSEQARGAAWQNPHCRPHPDLRFGLSNAAGDKDNNIELLKNVK